MPQLPTRHRRRPAGHALAAAVIGVLVVGSPVWASRTAGAQTATSGPLTLTVSQAADLDPAGQTVTVAGSGYDVTKGVYVALCVITPAGVAPGPCGGGIDTAGQAGAAQWISSNPPSYGVGLAIPYGAGGTFSTTFAVRAELAPGVDCRLVRCGIVTRNDHTRSSDRTQDVVVPVSFRTAAPGTPKAPAPTPVAPSPGPAPTGPAPAGTAGVAPTTTAPPSPTTTVATPTTAAPRTIAPTADGRGVTDGARTVTVSRIDGLDPDGGQVTVTGRGFDPARGVYVSLCVVAPDPVTAPGPCAGGPGASRWISTATDGGDLALPFGPDGSFEVVLDVAAQLDVATDCRRVPCAVIVRADLTAPGDRSLDLAVPVSFADATTTTAQERSDRPAPGADDAGAGQVAAARSASEEDDGTGGGVVAALVVVLAASAATAVVVRRRRAVEAP